MLKYFVFKRNTANNKKNNQRGFSLIEVSVSLLVIGLIALPFLNEYRRNSVRDSYYETQGILAQARDGINQYYASLTSSYPCPASLALGPGDTDYGVSGDCTLVNLDLCSSGSWFVSDGICKTSDTADAVIIGALPFATIKMQQQSELDFWDNKIIYAVTHQLTIPASTSGGRIRARVYDAATDTFPTIVNHEILLFSTGGSKVGGFSKDGVSISPCGPMLDGYDNENCDFDEEFIINDDSRLFSLANGQRFYDDVTVGQETFPSVLWFEHRNNMAYPDNEYSLTLAAKVGVGTNNPAAALHVDGGIKIERKYDPTDPLYSVGTNADDGGRLKVDVLCDNSADCMDTELITGSRPEMRCDASNNFYGEQAVTTIGTKEPVPGTKNTGVFCQTLVDITDTKIDPLGKVLEVSGYADVDCNSSNLIANGVNALGEIICVPIN